MRAKIHHLKSFWFAVLLQKRRVKSWNWSAENWICYHLKCIQNHQQTLNKMLYCVVLWCAGEGGGGSLKGQVESTNWSLFRPWCFSFRILSGSVEGTEVIGHDGGSALRWFLRGKEPSSLFLHGRCYQYWRHKARHWQSVQLILLMYQNIFICFFVLVGTGKTIFCKNWTSCSICEQSNWPALSRAPQFLPLNYILSP